LSREEGCKTQNWKRVSKHEVRDDMLRKHERKGKKGSCNKATKKHQE